MSKALTDQVTPITRRRMFKSKNKSLLTLRVSGSILGFLFLVAIFQPFFYTVDPAASDLSLRLQSPSFGGAVLGTDALGQDVYSRVIAGFRWSLGIGTVGTLLGCLIGITLGVSAAWNRKRLRVILSRVIDIGISVFDYRGNYCDCNRSWLLAASPYFRLSLLAYDRSSCLCRNFNFARTRICNCGSSIRNRQHSLYFHSHFACVATNYSGRCSLYFRRATNCRKWTFLPWPWRTSWYANLGKYA